MLPNFRLGRKNRMYKCQACGLEVDEIPRYRKNECLKDVQHYFINLTEREEMEEISRKQKSDLEKKSG